MNSNHAEPRSRRTRPIPSRWRLVTFAACLAAVSVASACSGDGTPSGITRPETPLVTAPGGTSPTEEPAEAPEEAAPEPTDAPAPVPTAAPEPEAPADGDDVEGDGATTEETVAVVLLILFVLGVILILITWLSRRSSARHHDAELRPRLQSISSRARWVVDQGVPAMLSTADPTALQTTWTTVNSTLVEVQQEANGLVRSVDANGGRALADLGAAAASLRSTVDTGYQMRLQHADDHDLVGATDRSVLAQCDQLRRAVDTFEMTTS